MNMTPKEMAVRLRAALEDKKGRDIVVLQIQDVSSLADYFVISSGGSAPQLKALAEACEKAMKEADILPKHVEGHRGGTWILQDYGDVVVHIFSEEAREFYNLEKLWQDAMPVES
jgi:ribosome-associated protein